MSVPRMRKPTFVSTDLIGRYNFVFSNDQSKLTIENSLAQVFELPDITLSVLPASVNIGPANLSSEDALELKMSRI